MRWRVRTKASCKNTLRTKTLDGLQGAVNTLSLRSGERARERGCVEAVEVVFEQSLQRPPLSPSLSPLLRRGEREKTLCRSRAPRFVVHPADCSVIGRRMPAQAQVKGLLFGKIQIQDASG